jgi:hypothetical protein
MSSGLSSDRLLRFPKSVCSEEIGIGAGNEVGWARAVLETAGLEELRVL